MSRRSIVFLAWGKRFIGSVRLCIEESCLPDCPILLITDHESDVTQLPPGVTVLRKNLVFPGKLAKLELLAGLPDDLETVLVLDVDTRVIGDVSLGFEKAERHGVAIAAAPHYSLEDFRSFRSVMVREGVPPKGQMIYNSGVMFFAANRPEVRAIFNLARDLAVKDDIAPWGDQPYVTLAMEIANFNPYTLSPSFNHRAFGELISGSIRIWHSYTPVPAEAPDNSPGFLRRYENGGLVKALKIPL